MKHFILILIISFLCTSNIFAQDDKKTELLARQYYQQGDYEKAAQLYENLYHSKSNKTTFYYTFLYNSYIRLKDFDKAEKIAKKELKRTKDPIFKIDIGYIYSQNNKAKEAEKLYNEAINDLQVSENEIRKLANKFNSLRQNNFTLKTYLKGQEILKNDALFSKEIAYTYIQNNEIENAIKYYILMLKKGSSPKLVQSFLSKHLKNESVQNELESQLYDAIQKNKNDAYLEMLVWLYSHQEDYEQAFIQAKALDKRNKENGFRVLALANSAKNKKQYHTAIDAYLYVSEEKGEQSALYNEAKTGEMKARKLLITQTNKYTLEDLEILKEKYESYINTYGVSEHTINAIRDLADLEALYLKNIDNAISRLENLLETPYIPKHEKNSIKLDLGDYYVLNNNVWEATLLYAQVDKDEKDSPIGEDARYRNARLSYYKGEFEWAQAQLDILKGATTELISNNAIELSVFITDNLGLDSTTNTMKMFAQAELLHKQNNDNEALKNYENILTHYPKHALTDDIYYKQAIIYNEHKEFEKAIEKLDLLLNSYGKDILADNALFLKASIYQFDLNEPNKAQEAYKKIITDYSDSVLLVEARKRYRQLRGDEI